jgi:hypothetical protein
MRGKFESLVGMKIKLRLSFAFFISLLLTRTIYFTYIKAESVFNAQETNSLMLEFNQQIYVYLSENLFSVIILTFMIKQINQSPKPKIQCNVKHGSDDYSGCTILGSPSQRSSNQSREHSVESREAL